VDPLLYFQVWKWEQEPPNGIDGMGYHYSGVLQNIGVGTGTLKWLNGRFEWLNRL